MLSCPAAEMVDGSEVLYLEQVTDVLLLCCVIVIDVNVFFSSCLSRFSLFSSGILEDSSETVSSSMQSFPSRIIS